MQCSPISAADDRIFLSRNRSRRDGGAAGRRWTGWGRTLGLGFVLLIAPGCGRKEDKENTDRGDGTKHAEVQGDAPLAVRVEALTGGPTRVVWARDMGKGKDTFANGQQLQLMAFDSRGPAGERVLVEKRGNFSRPLLAPDGQSVYFSRRKAQGSGDRAEWTSEIFVVPWTGGAPRALKAGYAVDVWQEPGGGRTWVLALAKMRDGFGANPEGERLFRFPVDDPAREEVLWGQGLVSGDNLQMNRAGTSASGLIPWPNAGTFDFPSGTFTRYRNGCWPSLAPDDSGLLWVFDGTHKNLRFFLPGVEDNWRVPLGGAEGMKDKAVYHPRWSNHPRIIAFTGPHPVKVNEGSGKVSIVLARLKADFTGLEASVNLKNGTGRPDCYPDVWVAGGEGVSLEAGGLGPARLRGQSAPPPAEVWQAPAEGLALVWERANANNLVPGQNRASSVVPRGHARYGPRFDMLTQGGLFMVDAASSAAVAAALASGTWSMEMAVTPIGSGRPQAQVIFRAGPALEIQQREHDFIIRTGGAEWILGAGLSPGKTTHLALGRAAAGEPPEAWLNGMAQELRPAPAGLAVPADDSAAEMIFGGRADGSAAWPGRVQNVAFRQAPLDPAVTAAHAAWWRARLAAEKPVARTVVKARLKEASPRPSLDDIKPYHRAWTSAVYEKIELLSGPDPGPEFGVAHWTLLDDRPVEGPPGRPGTETELTLEPIVAHPQMDSEFGAEEVLGADQTLFLDMAAPGVGGS